MSQTTPDISPSTAFSRLANLVDAMEVITTDTDMSSKYFGRKTPPKLACTTFAHQTLVGSTIGMLKLHHSTPDDLSLLFKPRLRPKVSRKRIDPRDTAHLQKLFDLGLHFPSREQRESLANQLSLTPRTVQVWFQNKRQSVRNRRESLLASSQKKESLCVVDENSRPTSSPDPVGHPHTPPMTIKWMEPIVVDSQGRPLNFKTFRKSPTLGYNHPICLTETNKAPIHHGTETCYNPKIRRQSLADEQHPIAPPRQTGYINRSMPYSKLKSRSYSLESAKAIKNLLPTPHGLFTTQTEESWSPSLNPGLSGVMLPNLRNLALVDCNISEQVCLDPPKELANASTSTDTCQLPSFHNLYTHQFISRRASVS